MTIVGARKQMEEQNQFDIGFFCEVKGKFTFLITSASAARIHREADAPFWGPNLYIVPSTPVFVTFSSNKSRVAFTDVPSVASLRAANTHNRPVISSTNASMPPHTSTPQNKIELTAQDDEIQPNTRRPSTTRATTPHTSTDLTPADLLNPSPDIHKLFRSYNRKYFSNRITHTLVEYSKRMTLCAGTCTFLGTGCRIGLSEPLLKLRPVEDLYSTLLHEMIHAYLFLTEGVAVRDGPDGHGPKFMSHAHRISEIEGLPITPYHTFTDEVEVYRTHHWRCDKCAMLIKRAMNRAPAPSDPFWSSHQRCCGGAFVKVAEPPKKQKPLRVPKNGAVAVGRGPAPKGAVRTMPIDKMLSQPPPKPPKKFVPCPVCNDTVEHHSLNAHLDKCLEQSMFTQAPPGSQPNSVPSKSKSNPVPDFRNHENPGNVVVIDDNPSSDTTRRDPSRARQARVKVSPPLRNARRTPPVAITPRRYLSAFQKHAQSFMNFAVKPNSETAKPVMDSLKLPTSPLPTPPEQPVDVVHILRPLIGPETPFDEEQRIRAKVNPSDQDFSFRETAKRLGTTAEELFQNVFANSRITPDGRRELSAEVIDLISPVSEPPRHRERDSSAYNRKRPGSAISFSNKKHKIDAPSPNFTDSPNRACPSEPMSSRGRETPSQLSLGKCPLCDKDVPRSQLQSHINTCLTDSDIAPYIFSDDETEPDPNKRETPKLQSTPGMGNVGDAPRCPICDKEMPREDLESHVATCMASMGLVDEF